MFKEKIKTPETEKIESRVILEFMRHGKKEVDKTKPEEEIRLTPEGKLQAVSRGRELKPQLEVSLARGSSKKRAQETSAHAMLANVDAVKPEASLEEMEAVIAEKLKIGKKIIEDDRLGYQYTEETTKDAAEAMKAGRYFPFIVEESDNLAIKRGDKISSCYTRYAGNIADIINYYTKISNNFNKIVSQKEEKYKKFGNRLERYLGNHMGSLESFIAKVLEKSEGNKKRDEFIKSVGGGFKETQGIHVEIENKGDEQKIFITFDLDNKKETIELDKETLAEIIKDREKFEAEIRGK